MTSIRACSIEHWALVKSWAGERSSDVEWYLVKSPSPALPTGESSLQWQELHHDHTHSGFRGLRNRAAHRTTGDGDEVRLGMGYSFWRFYYPSSTNERRHFLSVMIGNTWPAAVERPTEQCWKLNTSNVIIDLFVDVFHYHSNLILYGLVDEISPRVLWSSVKN